MAKLKFTPGGYQDLGAYALLKNIVENGHLIAEDGNSLLFPNGIEIVTESRDFQSSDEGKALIVLSDNPVQLTMPNAIIFKGGYALAINGIDGTENVSWQTRYNGPFIKALGQIDDGQSVGEHDSETVLFVTYPDGGDGNSILSPISTSIINDGGQFKTMLRYLYDKVSATPKIYEAVISQTGTDAPSLYYLFKDDLGDITFTRQGEGMYKIESAGGKFSSIDKSSLQWSFYERDFRTHITSFFEKDDDYAFFIRTYDSSGVLTDGQMTPITIKITVYP